MYTIVAEFAGASHEAEAFAKEHGLNYAKNKGTKPNGLPYVSLSGQTLTTLADDLAKLDRLGWDRHSVTVKVNRKLQPA
jgi:hypothetical protein